jgi:SAM-dependent methyltransferase
MNAEDRETLEKICDEELVSAYLSAPKIKSSEVVRVTVRTLLIKGVLQYQLTDHYATKVIHKNISKESFQELVKELLTSQFKQAVFYTVKNDYYIMVGKNGKISVTKKVPSKSLSPLSHNEKKNYLLEEGTPIPFLVEIGIMNSMGKVHADKRNKFKQMNRFLEIVRDILPAFKDKKKIRILDFGCGKAYLTFALYHYFHEMLGYDLEVIGLDLKKDVIEDCQKISERLGYKQIKFFLGDINSFEVKGEIDLMVMLHACNTATDAALEKAIRAKTEVILSVPCCQHELFSQIKSDHLNPLLEHGILKERFSALATDAARGKLLEILGYSVQILEFIDLEHTPKNILIRAVRKQTESQDKNLIKEYLAFKNLLQIEPSLEARFSSELDLH